MDERHSLFRVYGRVQGVMFRQTLIRAAQKRGLQAAASNLDDGSVSCLLNGDTKRIEEILSQLQSGTEINSWHARVDRLELLEPSEGLPFERHQVTTENVDQFQWSSGVEMYL